MVAELLFCYENSLFHNYSAHKNELCFAKRFVKLKGDLQAAYSDEAPSGSTMADKQREMKDWLATSVHYASSSNVWPTELDINAAFYGFSVDPNRIKEWLRGLRVNDQAG